MRSVRAKAVLLLLGGVLALGLLSLPWTIGPGSSQAQQGAMHNCPQAGKWAISVWDGADGTDTGQALATCSEGAVDFAYYVDPDTQQWLRYFAARTDISNLLTLNNMQGVLAYGAAPTPTPTPTPTVTAVPQEIMTVMTYNILNGGGVGPTDPEGEWCCGPPPLGCCHEPGGNRLPRILEVMKFVDPDILGIQEAFLWQLDDESIAREVAAELGMNYFIGEAEDPNAAHVVLFTKFDIKNAESYPTQFAAAHARAGLHAEIVTDSGQSIHVFVVHLRPEEGVSEVSFLVEEMSPYLDDLTVLMGDMNFSDPSWQASMLREAGWSHPLAEQQGIDQIWVSPALAAYVEPAPPIPTELTLGTSDHAPVAVEIEVYPP